MQNLFSFFYDNKRNFLFLIILFLSIVIDTSIGVIPDFITGFVKSSLGISIFVSISIITIVSIYLIQYLIINDNNKIVLKSKYLSYVLTLIKYVNYILMANLTIVVISILFFSNYSIVNLLLTNNIMAVIGSILLIVLSLKFIVWYIFDRGSIIILIYAASFFIFGISFFFGYLSENIFLIEKPFLINPSMEVVFPLVEDDPFEVFYHYYSFLIAISLILFLIGSYLLLNTYLEKVYRPKIIFSFASSFVLFIIANLETFDIIETPNSDQGLLFYYIFQTLSSAAAGMLIGYSFWKVSSILKQGNSLRKYLKMTSIGLILIFIITQGTLIMSPFPPFGLPSLSFVIISIYLFNFGLYATAITLSKDIKLRETIKIKTKKNTNLLESIGKAQMTDELNRAVKDVKVIVEKEEKELKERTGLESSISEDNIQDYMETVLKEISESRKKSAKIT